MNFVDGGEESEGLIFTGRKERWRLAGNAADREPRAAREGAGLHDRYVHRGDAEAQILEPITEQKYPLAHPIGAAGCRIMRNMLPRTGTATATTTSRTSSQRCDRGSRWWRMQCSGIVPPAPRC